ENDESAEKLKALKSAIERTQLPTPPFKDYPCEYAGLRINWRLAKLELDDTDRRALEEVAKDGLVDPAEYANLEPHLRELVHRFGTVQLEGLEKFGEQVNDWLWESICHKLNLPDQPPTASIVEADPLAEEQDLHELFMESRLRVYVGREKVLRTLTKFADGDLTVPCLVTGPSGSGKSAATAKFVTAYRDTHPDVVVIPHFIGASPASTSLRLMLRRLCLTLKNAFGFAEDVEQETQRLIGQFREFLGRVPADRRVLILLDAVNQLDETDNADQLHWLPWQFPAHVKVVVSCIDDPGRDEPVLKVLRKRKRHSRPRRSMIGNCSCC
ncbi:MAG: ATP-binding protein, partial [Planctomycetia bacterium]|nr:ATP-binding protein [Planctomycetia bacterium]